MSKPLSIDPAEGRDGISSGSEQPIGDPASLVPASLRGKPISPNDADERYSNVPAGLARSVSTLGQPLATSPHKPGRVVRPRMGHPPVRGRRIFKPLVGAGSLKFPLR